MNRTTYSCNCGKTYTLPSNAPADNGRCLFCILMPCMRPAKAAR